MIESIFKKRPDSPRRVQQEKGVLSRDERVARV